MCLLGYKNGWRSKKCKGKQNFGVKNVMGPIFLGVTKFWGSRIFRGSTSCGGQEFSVSIVFDILIDLLPA